MPHCAQDARPCRSAFARRILYRVGQPGLARSEADNDPLKKAVAVRVREVGRSARSTHLTSAISVGFWTAGNRVRVRLEAKSNLADQSSGPSIYSSDPCLAAALVVGSFVSLANTPIT